jgi:hypothetical protein
VILSTTTKELQGSSSRNKVRGPYTNWLIPSLWDLIYTAITKYKSFKNAMQYLQLKHKIFGQEKNIYDQLTRGSLLEWFTNLEELKDGTK